MPVYRNLQSESKIREGRPDVTRRLWRKGFVKQVSFKSEVKGRGSDRW